MKIWLNVYKIVMNILVPVELTVNKPPPLKINHNRALQIIFIKKKNFDL